MSKRITNWIAAPLLALTIGSSAQAAPMCVAPEPTCAIVLAGGIVLGVLTHDTERASPRSSATELPDTLPPDLTGDEHERLASHIRATIRDRAGFRTIVRRYEQGAHQGPRGLAALHASRPDLFGDLDRIDRLIGRHYPAPAMRRVYGEKRPADARINWARYAGLARTALSLDDGVHTVNRTNASGIGNQRH